MTKDAVIQEAANEIKVHRLDGVLLEHIIRYSRKLFAILAYACQSETIFDYVTAGVGDRDLPLHMLPESNMVHTNSGQATAMAAEWTSEYWSDFEAAQWLFLCPLFDVIGAHVDVHERCTLPLVYSSLIKRSAHGVQVYRIKIEASHLHTVAPNSVRNPKYVPKLF